MIAAHRDTLPAMKFALSALARATALASSALLASVGLANAQTPAIYEATPHGRVLACFGEAYALVELIDVATQNLALLAAELQRQPGGARPAVAAGLALSGTQADQRQSLDVAERLVECTSGAARRATPDAGASYTATAVREEIDVAITMADGFATDYQMLAARLIQFFAEASEPATKTIQIRPFSGFGDEIRSLLVRSRASIDQVIERSSMRP